MFQVSIKIDIKFECLEAKKKDIRHPYKHLMHRPKNEFTKQSYLSLMNLFDRKHFFNKIVISSPINKKKWKETEVHKKLKFIGR